MKRHFTEECAEVDCLNECCYLRKKDYVLSDNTIERVKSRVLDPNSKIKPEYRGFLQKLVKDNGFIEIGKFGRKHLKVDTTKSIVPDALSTLRYPCVFLANSENLESKDKECMIYPYRFSFCGNTTPEHCGPGLRIRE